MGRVASATWVQKEPGQGPSGEASREGGGRLLAQGWGGSRKEKGPCSLP